MLVCPLPRRFNTFDNILVRAIHPSPEFNNVSLVLQDFPAHGYPLDDNAPAYDLHNTRSPALEPVPLKYAFYLLAKQLDKTAPQHPMAEELAFYDCPEFRTKLYAGLVALVRNMRSRKDGFVAEMLGQSFTLNRKKDHFCVTIPATWNSSFQEVFLNVISEALSIPREIVNEDVTFVAESDAWAHDLLGGVHGSDRRRQDKSREEMVLVLSFGGHIMVCLALTSLALS